MDPYTFAAATKIYALVLPSGRIKRRQFDQYFTRLQQASEVRLMDVTPDHGNEKSPFNPQGYPNGKLVYRLELSPPPETLHPLFDVEPWRDLYVVLGIAYYKETTVQELEKELGTMRETYGAAVSCNILVFGVPEPGAFEGTTNIFPILSSNYTSLETAMCDVSANVLRLFAAVAATKKLGSFKSPGLKVLDHPSLTPSLDSATTIDKKDDAGDPPTEPRRSGRRHVSTPSGVTVSRTGSISMGLTERAKSRQRGRSLRFMGALYLLAGRLPEALSELAEAASILKAAHDHLWYASALESIAICLVLQAFYEVPVTIPTIALSAVGTDSELASPKSLKNVSQQLSQFLPLLMETVLRQWGRCSQNTEEAVPHLMRSESILRFANMLTCLRVGGGWNGATLSAVVRGTPLVLNLTDESPGILDIEKWCSQLVDISQLAPEFACRLLNGLCSIYSKLDMHRKRAFVVEQMIRLLVTCDSAFVSQFPPSLLETLYHQLLAAYRSRRLKIDCIKVCIELARRIGFYKFAVRASCMLLATGVGILDSDEQKTIHQIIIDDGEIDNEYWDPHLLRDLRLHTKTSVSPHAAPSEKPKNGPIVYNPYAQPEKEVSTVVCGDNNLSVEVFLQNPFGFEVHIYELAVIDVDGNQVGDPTNDIFLPPGIVHKIMVKIRPDRVGPLSIAGCHIQVSGCVGKDYYLDTATKLDQVLCGQTLADKENEKGKERRPAVVDVLPPRATLVLRKTSLQKGWAMLLEGEKLDFAIEIANISSTPCTNFQFGFNDSTVEPLKQAIANPEATRADIYELEYFLYKRKAIQMLSPSKPLLANSTESYKFELSGKRGITSAAILVDYGETPQTSYRLRIPVSVTVYPSVELDRFEMRPLSKDSTFKGDLLIVLDLQNSWRENMDVSLWTFDDKGKKVFEVTHTIGSNRSERFLLPLEWSYVSTEDLLQPIPFLGAKQFVVDTKTSPETNQSFWLREKLLGKVGGQWTIKADSPATQRCGSVEFRGIQLTRRMFNLMKMPPLYMHMYSVDEPALNELASISVKILNKTGSQKSGMLRLVSSELKSVLYVGALQLPVAVPPHESTTVAFQVIPLVLGSFAWSAIYDVIGGGQIFLDEPFVLHVKKGSL